MAVCYRRIFAASCLNHAVSLNKVATECCTLSTDSMCLMSILNSKRGRDENTAGWRPLPVLASHIWHHSLTSAIHFFLQAVTWGSAQLEFHWTILYYGNEEYCIRIYRSRLCQDINCLLWGNYKSTSKTYRESTFYLTPDLLISCQSRWQILCAVGGHVGQAAVCNQSLAWWKSEDK